MKILIIDDSHHCAHVLLTILMSQNSKHIITVVLSVEQFEQLDHHWYDVIFMDIRMQYNGVKLIKHIRPCYKGKIIAYTAHAIKGDKEKYLDLGFDFYVSKPFDAEYVRELMELIEDEVWGIK